MVRVPVGVRNLTDVMSVYTKIELHSCATADGTFALVTSVPLDINQEMYWLIDSDGDGTDYYKVRYANADDTKQSAFTAAAYGGRSGPVGYTFKNYTPPAGEWGVPITTDDLLYTYLFGIKTTAQDLSLGALTEEQIAEQIDMALADFENYLTIDIRRRKYATLPAANLKRAKVWRDGVDYTHEEDEYDFDPQAWSQFGFIQLRHRPIIQINKAFLMSIVAGELIDLVAQQWIRVNKAVGQVNLFPRMGMSYGPFAVGANIWRINMGAQYPQGFRFDYETGYVSSDYMPEDLRDVIAKWASIKILSILGDAQYPGLASMSVSLDGLSESKSLTKSAQTTLYGARIKQYIDDVTLWLTRNRYKFSMPIGFVGAM